MLAADILGGGFCGHAMSGGRAATRFPTEWARSGQCHQPMLRGSSWIHAFFRAAPALSTGTGYNDLLRPLTDAILRPPGKPIARPSSRRSPVTPTPVSSGAHRPAAAHTLANTKRSAMFADSAAGSWGSGGWTAAQDTLRKTIDRGPRPSSAGGLPGHRGLAPGKLAGLAQSSSHSKRALSELAGLTQSSSHSQRALRELVGLARSSSHSQRALSELVGLAQPSGNGRSVAIMASPESNPSSANSHDSARQNPMRAANTQSVMAVPRFPPHAVCMDALTPSVIRDWQARMGERVRVRLHSTIGADNAVAAASDMQELWALPVDGPAASLELLLPDVEPCAAATSSADALPSADAVIAPPIAATVAGSSGAKELSVTVGHPPPMANPGPSLEGATIAALQVLGDEVLSKAHDEPWIPSLLPVSHSGPGGELKCASSPASMTRTEIAPLPQDLDLGEDLTELSLKIRRVLKEEARRHGIDV